MNATLNIGQTIGDYRVEEFVKACFEEKLPKDANLEDIVPYAVVTLFHARQQFYEQLKKA